MTTPYYLYDIALLKQTLAAIQHEIAPHANYHVHYAVKANANAEVLRIIAEAGLGADCVSGGEIQAALNAGFPAEHIVYAGVGKADWEIKLALQHQIGYFNVESHEELQIIRSIAREMNCKAKVCFRINPNVGAHTHAHITTGKAENKFGIDKDDLLTILKEAMADEVLSVVGLHFHIGSQILDMSDFEALALRINDIQNQLDKEGLSVGTINVGGGLGVDYQQPAQHPIPDFKSYFQTYERHLKLRPAQELHFELGRAVVAQMGSLITQVLYVKQGKSKAFVIVDAGMSDLIRPALYGSYHKIEKLQQGKPLTDAAEQKAYDIVGPICESSDVFVRDELMPVLQRGDLLAIRSAGAYGRVMSSQYNLRQLPDECLSQS